VLLGCQPPSPQGEPEDTVALKSAFEGAFLVGSALNSRQFSGADARGVRLVTQHYNTITAENSTKWEVIHPEPGRYDFSKSDEFVAFGDEHGMFIVGHTLVWHHQTPGWVLEDDNGDPLSRDALLERMRDHILTVVGRYRGRIDGWDVVNEAINDDGTLRNSRWREIIGDDYIEKAFEFAHEADPEAELYYNDYSLPNPGRRDGAVALVRDLQAKGVPVHGVGLQGHYGLDYPSTGGLDSAVVAFGELGVDVMITELDIDVLPWVTPGQGADLSVRGELSDEVNPFPVTLPDSMQQALANQYADLFRVLLDNRDVVTRVTFWGVTDGDSWKNNWPVPGRTNYPLLFDRQGLPKPAFYSVVEVAGLHD
jgi:endo-1,4-beta-xylanase